jgi:hypothetical protein
MDFENEKDPSMLETSDNHQTQPSYACQRASKNNDVMSTHHSSTLLFMHDCLGMSGWMVQKLARLMVRDGTESHSSSQDNARPIQFRMSFGAPTNGITQHGPEANLIQYILIPQTRSKRSVCRASTPYCCSGVLHRWYEGCCRTRFCNKRADMSRHASTIHHHVIKLGVSKYR